MRHRFLSALIAFLMCLGMFSGCTKNNIPILVFEEKYEYSISNAFFLRPSFTNQGSRLDAFKIDMDEGWFYCFTQDSDQADEFINAQRTLLCFLRDCGMDIRKLRYFATDYDDSFSDSSHDAAYIALSSTKSYMQVAVTLQSLWDDYIDYGYIYGMSNLIADRLGWRTDSCRTVERVGLDQFFKSNPNAVHLLYPCFTVEFASEETVENCKSLSKYLFEGIDWIFALKKPIELQVNDFHALVGNYAEKNGISFFSHNCGYAYYGEYLPLRIRTTYAELMVDKDYSDYSDIYDNYFSDYVSIYRTADIIDREISEAVSYFHLEDRAGFISLNWLSSDSAETKYGKELVNFYKPDLQEVTVTTITGYLHEYFHHIEHLLNPDLGQCWQSQAFCEIGRSHSHHSQYMIENAFTQSKEWIDLFEQCTGREYHPGVNDYYESYDILCYITNEFDLDYYYGRNGINSFAHYLIDSYGEKATYNMMLFPETVFDVTEKTWDELEIEWKEHIQDKYAGVEIPKWEDDYI